jgi:Subtilase family
MSREQLNTAAQHFFQRILPATTGKRLSDLQNAEVLLGAYRLHAGGPVQSFGRSITPQYMLKVGRTPLPIQSGSVALGTAPVGDDAADQPLIWMRFAADAKVDDQATIRDLMGDLDTYAQRKFSVAGVEIDLGADAPVPPNSEQWSQAIQNNRAAVPDNLSTLTAVPEGLKSVAPDVHSLRMILGHFFTYDENGGYYPRWSGAGRQIPNDLSEPYKQNNVRELQLQREQLYLYMLTPKQLFTAEAAEPHDYRESVVRFDAIGDPSNPFLPTLVHSVYKRIETPHPFHDFVFFESEDGLGLPIPAAARESISPAVTQFLTSIPENPTDRALFFEKSKYVIAGDPPMVQLLATVEGELQLPPDVEVMASGEGGLVYSVLAPPERVIEVAAHPSVKYLSLDGNPERPTLDSALPVVDFSTFCAKFEVTKRDGEGVLVGIIDSGIDGKHPAFNDASGNSRIVAVWQQDEGRKGNALSPAAKHPGNKAYGDFDHGKEYTGADVVNATDDPADPGHGTHVAGIAAGAAVTHANGNVSRGLASKAKIVMEPLASIKATSLVL